MLLGALANNNVIEGNIIGLNASASLTPFVPQNAAPWGTVNGHGQYIGVWISDGSANRVGGSAAGAGNVIVGNAKGVYISGGSALGNWVAGNQIGWAPTFTGGPGGQIVGVLIDANVQQTLVGGSAGAGNTIGGMEAGISERGSLDTLQGNWIGISPDGKTGMPVGFGMAANGANSPLITQNTIANAFYDDISLNGLPSGHVSGNQISAPGRNGIMVLGSSAGTVIYSNTIAGAGSSQRGNGVDIGKDIGESGAVTISRNSITGSSGLGICLNSSGKPTLIDSAQPIQLLFGQPPPLWTSSQLQITGDVAVHGGLGTIGTYLLEFFSNIKGTVNHTGYGEGQTFLGSARVTVGPTGSGTINVTLPSPNNLVSQFLTATATDADGNTTEFSPAVMIQPCVPGIKGICPGIEAMVPNLPTPPGNVRPKGGTEFGDGNGDGIPDSQESNVASLPSLLGLWVTLSAPTGIVLENVTPTGPPDFTSLPAGYIFPIGFLSFGITNFPRGGAVTVTNFLHLDADTNFSYAATTYFNFGPTPDNLTPHWYEFLFDGTTGAELLPDRIILHFQDGARGDDDVTVNGDIETMGAPAYALAPAPQLSISIAAAGSSNIVDVIEGTNDAFVLVTNAFPAGDIGPILAGERDQQRAGSSWATSRSRTPCWRGGPPFRGKPSPQRPPS